MMNNILLSIVGGRKAAAFLTGLAATLSVYFITGSLSDQLVDMLKFLVATYVAGNVGTDIVSAARARREVAKPTGNSEAASAALAETVGAMVASQTDIIKSLKFVQNGMQYLVTAAPQNQGTTNKS